LNFIFIVGGNSYISISQHRRTTCVEKKREDRKMGKEGSWEAGKIGRWEKEGSWEAGKMDWLKNSRSNFEQFKKSLLRYNRVSGFFL
jgi:hypothetical protein